MLRNDQTRYGVVAQSLHWIIAALIVVMFGLGWYMGDLPLGQHQYDMYVLHKSLGITIFALAVVRLIWRLVDPPPQLPATMPLWERHAAKTVHVALYVMLFVQPTIGLLQSNAVNFPVVVWNVLPMPALIGVDEPLGETLVGVHEWGSRIIMILVALHVAAALRHHFLIKDDVLRRMLPGAQVRGS